MEKTITIPEFTNIQEMAEFWDTHEITDFETALSEVSTPLFNLPEQHVISVRLDETHYTMLQKLGRQEHFNPITLVQEWITQTIEEKYQAGQQHLNVPPA